jgi:hypothetical protein
MYPTFLVDVAAQRNADMHREAAALRRARAARLSRKTRRGGAGHKPAPASARPVTAAECHAAVPAQAAERERELTCAAR